MITENSYTRMITRLAFEVIPDYEPPVTVSLQGRYALGDTHVAAQVKVPAPINISIKLEVPNGS